MLHAHTLTGGPRTVLADHGIDPDTPAGAARATALLGAEATALLTDPSAPPPDHKTVRSMIVALENLETPR